MSLPLLDRYDLLQLRLATARDVVAAAKHRHDAAVAELESVQAELHALRGAMASALAEGPPSVASPSDAAADLGPPSSRSAAPLQRARPVAPGAVSRDSAPERGRVPPEVVPKVPEVHAPPAPDGLRPSVWEVALVLPEDGHVGMEDLQEALALNSAALNTRVTKAKKAGLIESAGWGRYQLSALGRRLRGLHS